MLRAFTAALVLCGIAGCVPEGKPGEPGSSGKYKYSIHRTWNERTHEASVKMTLDLANLDNSCGLAALEVEPIVIANDDVGGANDDQVLFDALMRRFDETTLAEPASERRACLSKLKARMQSVLQSCPLPSLPCAFQSVQARNP